MPVTKRKARAKKKPVSMAAPKATHEVAPSGAPALELGWKFGLLGLALCALSVRFVFPWSAFAGLSLLGVGTLAAGMAFGRD